MTQEQIIEGNKLIAEFIGCKKDKYWNNWYKVPKKYQKAFGTQGFGIGTNCRFHSSWDWLMPVLTEIGNRTSEELVIHSETCYWNTFGDNNLPTEFLGYNYPLVDGIWFAVVEFIKWYNANK